jgi:hypothetical protein
MKVSVNCDFKPIELTIVIETPEELNDLYARVNAPSKNVEDYRLIKDLDVGYSNIKPLWKAIRTECRKYFGKD